MLELYQFQRKYFQEVKRNWIYDMDTGTGKTIMALHHYKNFYDGHPIVIYAPASKVKEGGWQREIEECKIKAKVQIISYNKMPKFYKEIKNCFVIFDEAHRIKDSTGVWGKTANSIAKRYCIGFVLLTATPLSNGWVDSINYFKMFFLVSSKYQFMQNHAIVNTYKGYPEIIGWQNTKQLENKWKAISKRLNKSEAIDLPEVIEQEIFFKPDAKYNKIKRTRILNSKVFDNMMAWRHGLRSNTSTDDKIQYLTDLAEDTESNIVIFYNYNEELISLRKALRKTKTVYECNGHLKTYPKKTEWKDTKSTVTLVNYKSGSEAVEFTYADILVFFSPTESYTDYYQSVGRLHRIGQKSKVTIYKFITENTIEVDIYKSLDNKENFNFEVWYKNEK